MQITRRILGLFSSFINTGVTDPHNVVVKRTAHISNTYGLIIFLYMAVLGVQVSMAGDRWLALFDFAIALLYILNYLFLRYTGQVSLSADITLVLLGLSLLFLTVTGGKTGTGPLWAVIFPTISMQLKGHRSGTVYSAIFICVTFTLLVFFRTEPWFFPYDQVYPNAPTIISRLLLICVGLSLMSYSFARNRFELQNEIERISLTDTLTGLPNRRYINQIVDFAVKDFKRKSHANAGDQARPFSLILCDIDDFKKINDGHGHLAGDQALKGVASLLRRTLRESDFTGRWGGEEFLILLRETNAAQAEVVARKLQTAAHETPIQVKQGLELPITLSFGVSCYNHNQDLDAFISSLDKKLYTAKSSGKNCIVTD